MKFASKISPLLNLPKLEERNLLKLFFEIFSDAKRSASEFSILRQIKQVLAKIKTGLVGCVLSRKWYVA